MNIDEAKEILSKCVGNDEIYHEEFDNIIEKRLMELDPDFMNAMQEEYKRSNMGRWCA